MTTDCALLMKNFDADRPKPLFFQGWLMDHSHLLKSGYLGVESRNTRLISSSGVLNVNIIGIQQFLKIA